MASHPATRARRYASAKSSYRGSASHSNPVQATGIPFSLQIALTDSPRRRPARMCSAILDVYMLRCRAVLTRSLLQCSVCNEQSSALDERGDHSRMIAKARIPQHSRDAGITIGKLASQGRVGLIVTLSDIGEPCCLGRLIGWSFFGERDEIFRIRRREAQVVEDFPVASRCRFHLLIRN